MVVVGEFNKYISIFILILVILSLFYIPLVYSPDLSACATLNTSTTYTLTQNVETTGDCFLANGNNIILNCQGFNVTGDGGATDDGFTTDNGDAIWRNVTVRGCTFQNFQNGVNYYRTNSSTLFNNTIRDSVVGLFINEASFNNISLNTIYNISGNGGGISLTLRTSHNDFRNNTIYNVTVGISAPVDGTGSWPKVNLTILNNTIYNTTLYGGLLLESSNSSNISFNVIYNANGQYGIDLTYNSNILTGGSYRNIIYSNTIYNVSTGIRLNNAFDTNVSANSIYNNSAVGILVNNSERIRIYSHTTLENNTFRGVNVDFFSNYTNISSNTIRGHNYGITVQESSLYNNITLNTIFNNSVAGIQLLNSNYTNITSNTLSNNTLYGLLISNGSYNNVSFNTIFNNSQAGIFINGTRAEGNRFFQNTIHNHTAGLATGIYVNTTNLINHIYGHNLIQNNTYGIYSDYANYTNITNNNITRNTNTGLLLSFSNNVNISNNTFFNNTRIGVNISRSIDTILNNNLANYSQYGFNVIYSNRLNFSENNATNNSNSQYYFDFNSNATFLGVNRALNHTVNVSDIGIYGSSNITTRAGTTYNNFTTSFGTFFFDAATNVSMEAVSFANSGVTETGCTGFSGTCTLITPSDFVINITNNDNSATADLGIYYDATSSPSTSNIYIGRYSGSGWERTGQTSIDSALRSVRYNGITSFSIFGAVNFVATPAATTTTTTTSDDSGSAAVTTPATSESSTAAADTGESLPESTTVTVEVVESAAEEEVTAAEEVTATEEEAAEEEGVFEATAPFQAIAKLNVEKKIEGTDDSESAQLVYGTQKGRIGGVDVEIPKVNLNLQIKKPKTITATLDLDLIPYMRHTMSLLFLLFIALSLLTIKDASEYVTEIPRGITAKSYLQPKPLQKNVYITVNDWINNGNRRL